MINRVSHSRSKEELNPVRNHKWSAVRSQDLNRRWTGRSHNPANAASKEEPIMEAEDKENPVEEIMEVETEEEDFK